jgi:hypothetical protein
VSIFGTALVAAAAVRGRQLAVHAADPRPVQERALLRLLERARDTQFGRQHGFARLRSSAEFKRAVPLHRYEDLKPWFERALAGESNVTWPGRIRYFGMSSGTTAGNKYLPLSRDSIRQQARGGFDPVAAYLRWTGDCELLSAKALLLGSSTQLERKPSGVLVGDNTGIMARNMPWLVRRSHAPSARVRAITDWDDKLVAIARESIDLDVRLLAGTPSWFLGLFDQLLSEAARRGRPARHVHDVWPNLRMLTGGGVNYEPYRALVRSRLGRHVPYVDVYNATEGGIMGVQDRVDAPELAILPDNGLYYEFVPISESSAPSTRRLSLWEVERDVVYALAISTMSGIWSYLIGDCVRFTDLYPHRFVFEGRSTAFLNLTGEHVSQAELERAVDHACQVLSARMRDFTVVSDVARGNGASTAHSFLIEFDGNVPELERCAQLIDAELRRGNTDYSTHRDSRAGLAAPQVRALRAGAFHDWMRSRGKLGGQHKVPRVLTDKAQREWLEACVRQPLLGSVVSHQ